MTTLTLDPPVSRKCHRDTFGSNLADLTDEHHALVARAESGRIRWLARVAVRLYPIALGNEGVFRADCIARQIARHGRTATMLIRTLVDGDIGNKTAQRWADCIAYAHDLGEDEENAVVAAILDLGGIVGTHEHYRATAERQPAAGQRAVETLAVELQDDADSAAYPDLILTASQSGNADVFPEIMSLYVATGSTVADVTYGKGVFWTNIPPDTYDLVATDLMTGVDCRQLPYDNESIDCVVFDPPYMHTPGGTAHNNHQNFEEYYQNNHATSNAKYHEAVLDLYYQGAVEAHRILKYGGVYIVKCQDEICANRQRLTHVEIINEFERQGFVTEDLFVVVRHGQPGVSRLLNQVHARKNHSYFIVFIKQDGKKRWPGIAPDDRFFPF